MIGEILNQPLPSIPLSTLNNPFPIICLSLSTVHFTTNIISVILFQIHPYKMPLSSPYYFQPQNSTVHSPTSPYPLISPLTPQLFPLAITSLSTVHNPT